MGMFDQLKNQMMSQVISRAIPGGDNPLVRAAVQLVMASGGISGLQERFQSKGLGDVSRSWIGRGANRPVDESQLTDIFGADEIDHVARDNGFSSPDLARQLSGFLPRLVDRMTPEGREPTEQPSAESFLSTGLGLIKTAAFRESTRTL